MINVYIFTESPINKVYSRKIQLDFIIQNFHTEIWTTLIKSKIYFKNSKNYSFNSLKYNFILNKYDLLKKLLKIKGKKNLFIYLDYNSSINIFFLFLLRIFNIKFIVPPRRTPLIFSRIRKSIFFRILKRDKTKLHNEIKYKIKFLFFNILNNLNFIQNPDIIFICGHKGFNYWHKKFKPKKIVKTKSVDISYLQFDKLLNYNYCVYIDENKNFSPDLSFLKNKSAKTVTDIDSFYNNLNDFFVKVENKFNCKVVISSSLKFDYNNKNPFFNRPIFYDKTDQLIKHSKIVICHHSSAYWQAIYDLKKIYFLTDKNLEFYNQNSTIKDNAALLNMNTLDTSDEIPLIDKSIDIQTYKKILFDYFLSEDDRDYKDIIIEEINNLF